MNLIHLRRAVDAAVQNRETALLSEPVLLGARPAVLASLAHAHNGPVLILTGRSDQAELLCPRIAAYLPAEQEPRLWDTPHSTPYEQLPYEHRAAAERVRVLTGLIDGQTPIIVASARNLMHLTLSPDDLRSMRRTLRVGERITQTP